MEQALEKYFIDNGKLKPVGSFYDFLNESGTYIFEVVRVIGGIPLFVEEHLERLRNSAVKTAIGTSANLKEIKESVHRLISKNNTKTGNIKIVCGYYREEVHSWIYFIPYKYPSEKDYSEGVEVGILYTERINPEAKTIQPQVRETANALIKSGNYYEVLLADRHGYIREGSRSNVFFIQGSMILTPPESTVLNGITRRKVLEILNQECCKFKEAPVRISSLGKFDCIFLTGTSPKVLPVRSVDGIVFDPCNQTCRKIMARFNALADLYISGKIKKIY